jgi:hypothetical protein
MLVFIVKSKRNPERRSGPAEAASRQLRRNNGILTFHKGVRAEFSLNFAQ